MQSMTGFASLSGAHEGVTWTWEMRSVNARGLDVKLRLPDGLDRAEAALRAAVSKAVKRGNITCTFRVAETSSAGAVAVNGDALQRMLMAVQVVVEQAAARGLEVSAGTAPQILALRGVLDAGAEVSGEPGWAAPALAQITELVSAFVTARQAEGDAISKILREAIEEVATLTAEARDLLASRAEEQRAAITAKLSRVLEEVDGADPGRLEQELALIAIRSDVTEELDRLDTHVAAARTLLAEDGPVGRKLDFLMQEFNREANTLCSKAGFADLTQKGLALKVVIDQMREQVQNVE